MQPPIDLGFAPTRFGGAKPTARPERGRSARSAAERAGGTPARQQRRFGETAEQSQRPRSWRIPAEQSHRVDVRRGLGDRWHIFYKTNLQKRADESMCEVLPQGLAARKFLAIPRHPPRRRGVFPP